VPSTPGTLAILNTTNTFESQNPLVFPPAVWSAKNDEGDNGHRGIINDYSGGVYNPYWGSRGCMVFHGGGHSGYWGNQVVILDLDDLTFKRLPNSTTNIPTHSLSYITPGDDHDPLYNGTYAEYGDGRPGSAHTYDSLAILPPDAGGGANGSLVRVISSNVHPNCSGGTGYSHKFDFVTQDWVRWSTNGPYGADAGTSAYDSKRKRFWYYGNPSSGVWHINYLDATTRTHSQVSVPGVGFGGKVHSNTMVYDPVRDILVITSVNGNTNQFSLGYLDCANPSSGYQLATMSQLIPGSDALSYGLSYVPDADKFVLITWADANAVYEFTPPSNLSSTWQVTRSPFLGQSSLPWTKITGGTVMPWKRWSYCTTVKAFVYLPDPDGPAYVYRPGGT